MKMHLIYCFIAQCAKTYCGIYVNNEDVTAYSKETTCKNCRRVKKSYKRW